MDIALDHTVDVEELQSEEVGLVVVTIDSSPLVRQLQPTGAVNTACYKVSVRVVPRKEARGNGSVMHHPMINPED